MSVGPNQLTSGCNAPVISGSNLVSGTLPNVRCTMRVKNRQFSVGLWLILSTCSVLGGPVIQTETSFSLSLTELRERFGPPLIEGPTQTWVLPLRTPLPDSAPPVILDDRNNVVPNTPNPLK